MYLNLSLDSHYILGKTKMHDKLCLVLNVRISGFIPQSKFSPEE